MKKLLYVLSGILSLCLSVVLVILTILFINPTVLVNEKNIKWALEKTDILESWTWKKMEINHDWKRWNRRHLTGEIRDFCFRYRKDVTNVYSCFSEISWDFDVMYSFKDGPETRTYKPFVIHSPQLELALGIKEEEEEESSPPDIYRYWTILWSGMIPDMNVRFDSILVKTDESTKNFDFFLEKRAQTLRAHALKVVLTADPKGFEIKGPEALRIPEKIKTAGPYFVRDATLKGKVKKNMIPLHLTGSVEEAAFDVKAILDLPVKTDLAGPEFRRDFLSTVMGEIRIPEFRKTYKKRAPAAFRELPAPLNVMDGFVLMKFELSKGKEREVDLKSVTSINLSSSKEVLNLDVEAGAGLPVMTMKPDEISLGIHFHEVKLELPKISKKSPPPQFLPDKRFQKGPWKPPEEKEKPATDVNIHLTALNRKALHIKTNLLDEALRLNFDLLIGNGKVKRGHVTALPLETEIFRRPVHVKKMVVTFKAPLEPVIVSTIEFPLPEYKITMDLEGPVNGPRYAFRSEPPLPQNDIYAVLLFGRPLADLDPDDKTAAQKTNQILANGILSLSVLYFLAGSPVEYVGFDPESGNARAQFGLGRKTSLRVGGGQEGMNSGAVRHSLGKGWYIDTSVQSADRRATEEAQDYGVLLERVIAY